MIGRYLTTTAAKVLAALSGALLVACICLTFWGRAESARADKWQVKSIAERDNHRATKANFRAAQDAAGAAARAQRLETERRSAAIAKEIDHANDEADRWRAAAQRFADAGGVQDGRRSAVAGAAGGTGAAGEAAPAPGHDGPGSPAVVWLSRGDFDTLTGNTDRLLRLHALGERWIAEGWAVKGED